MINKINTIAISCTALKNDAAQLAHKVLYSSTASKTATQINKLQELLLEADILKNRGIGLKGQIAEIKSDSSKADLIGWLRNSLKGAVNTLAVAEVSIRNSTTTLKGKLNQLCKLHSITNKYEAVKQRVKAPMYYKRYSGKINTSLTGILGRVMSVELKDKLVLLQPLAKQDGEASNKEFFEMLGLVLYEFKRDLYIKCNSGGLKKRDEFYLVFKLALANWDPASAKLTKGRKKRK